VEQTCLEPRADGTSRHIESSDDSKDADAKERSWPFRPQRCSAFGLSTICTHPSSERGIPMAVFRRHSDVKPNRTETTNHKLGSEIHNTDSPSCCKRDSAFLGTWSRIDQLKSAHKKFNTATGTALRQEFITGAMHGSKNPRGEFQPEGA
jgi:hypothetical protein